MKRTPLKKKSNQKTATLKRKLWKVFADWVKVRDNYTCFTCNKKVEGFNCQGGHFIPKAAGGLLLYFHPDNVHVQCGGCNLSLQGNQHVYGQKLGTDKVAELWRLKNKMVKWTAQDYMLRIDFYTYLITHGKLPENHPGFEGGPLHYESPRSGS